MKKQIEVDIYICDGCGKTYIDEWGHSGYPGYNMWNKAYADEWEEIDGKHYCPECYEFDIDEKNNCCTNYRPNL